METTKEILKLNVNNLDIDNFKGDCLILRSNEPTCIYNLLDVSPSEYIYINYYGKRFLNYSTRTFTANLANHNSKWYIDQGKVAYLTTEGIGSLMPIKKDDYNLIIKIGNLNISTSIWTQRDTNKLVEENGKFFIRILGCNFPIENWERKLGYTKFNEILYNGRNLPLKEKDPNLYRKYLLSKFPVITDPSYLLDKKLCEGISKTLLSIQSFSTETDPLKLSAFKIAAENSKKTINNVKFSVVFNKLFENIDTQEKFSNKLSEIVDVYIQTASYYHDKEFLEKLLDTLPEAREIKKTALKRKSTGAFNKIMDDLDFVKIDKDLYPLTHEAVHSGDIPLGTFFRKTGESYFIFNDNWELWEEMLTAYPDEAKQIAATCSGRTTYEKDIMSYFYCVLYKLPEYLEKHTGKKWKGIPKLVNSSNELDPPTEGSNGVAKSRSALTPIVDNDFLTVTLPYVSMQVSGGYGTTYCYGLDYNILERGLSWSGNVVTKDIEKALNGRDDYGLMFYTLTGTAQGRGYPTFLIIFENLKTDVRVHFHRVHPTRSKGGDYNPIHNWTIGCYKWMIGNVNFDKIKAQQGDLAFVEIENLPKDTEITKVNSYDSHMFEQSVDFAPYTKKDNQNVLGYVVLENDTKLSHHEHLNRLIPAGTYEIRQCRSWEANPKGVWSLRID